MGEGRGSAVAVLCIVATVAMVFCGERAEGAVYTVGGANGWTFDMTDWPSGKHFRAGDILVFKYNTAYHNVVKVNVRGYRSCTVPAGSKVWNSGNDRVKLVRGGNYFICSFPGHCRNNMKIAIAAK